MQKRYRPNRQSRRGNNHSSNSSNPTSSQTSTPNHSNSSHSPRPPRPRPDYIPVPVYASILEGSAVSIILKQDQPTGRQVQGLVAEILTRGDHPRGVKVRLRDGRVGRVQKVVSEEEGVRGEEGVGGTEAGLGRNGEVAGAGAGLRGARGGGRRGGYRHVRDVREDDEYLYDEMRVRESSLGGYFAALEEADARHDGGRGWVREAGERPEMKNELVTCPVCGVFEGDETAVAHHVESHFQDES